MNNYDVGLEEDFNNMTLELGTEITIYPRDFQLGVNGQEIEKSCWKKGIQEIGVVNILGEKDEAVAAGFLEVGDASIVLFGNTIAKVEDVVKKNNKYFKIIKITPIDGFNNDITVSNTARAVKLSNR